MATFRRTEDEYIYDPQAHDCYNCGLLALPAEGAQLIEEGPPPIWLCKVCFEGLRIPRPPHKESNQC